MTVWSSQTWLSSKLVCESPYSIIFPSTWLFNIIHFATNYGITTTTKKCMEPPFLQSVGHQLSKIIKYTLRKESEKKLMTKFSRGLEGIWVFKCNYWVHFLCLFSHLGFMSLIAHLGIFTIRVPLFDHKTQGLYFSYLPNIKYK